MTGDTASSLPLTAGPRKSTTPHSAPLTPLVPAPSQTDISTRATSPAPGPVSSPNGPAPIAPSSRSKKRKPTSVNPLASAFSEEEDETSLTSSRKRSRVSDPRDDEAFGPTMSPSDAQSGVIKSLEPSEKVKKPRKSRAKAPKAKDIMTQDDVASEEAQNPNPTAAEDASEPTRHDADDEPELVAKKKKKPSSKKTKTSKVVVSEDEANDSDTFAPPENVQELVKGKEGAAEEVQLSDDEGPPPATKNKKATKSKAKLAAQDEDDPLDAQQSSPPPPTPAKLTLVEVRRYHSIVSF